MDGATVHGDAPEAESCKGNSCFFIEDLSSSEDEPEIQLSDGKRTRSCRQPPRLSSESSPPLLLAFSTASQWVHSDSSQSPAPASDRQVVKEGGDDDSDQTIEEWMILGTEGQAGDSSIQLHLSYWNSSEEESGGEGESPIGLECCYTRLEEILCCYHFILQCPSIMCQVELCIKFLMLSCLQLITNVLSVTHQK